jgi:chromosomal replication initiation ATPase DnaA
MAAMLAADAFQIPLPKVIAGTRGSAESAHARQAAMYLAHVALGIPITAIGRFFGRDHSTIAHGCRRVEDRRDDSGFDVLIAELALAARIAMHLDREITA